MFEYQYTVHPIERGTFLCVLDATVEDNFESNPSGITEPLCQQTNQLQSILVMLIFIL